MQIIKIDKAAWDAGVEKSRSAYRLVGPVEKNGIHEFALLADGQLPDMGYKNTRLSPKSIAFPPSEVMFTYSLDETEENHHIVQDVEKDYSAQAVIGIRPFDAKAFKLVEMNFDNPDYQDPYWVNAYNCCTFVGLAINTPDGFDFSTSCGTGPFDETGLDVLLVDAGSEYLAKVVTDKGKAWLDAAGFTEAAGDDAAAKIDALKAEAEAKITSTVAFDKIKEKTILDLFNAELWEDAAFGCINCGTCTYACPTCWCFDIQDVVQGNKGIRTKDWDSCMTGLFTVHATGHNPREHEYERTRQRFMHKLKYFLDKYDKGIMCVGCGRCVEQCPGNIDIRKICELMNA